MRAVCVIFIFDQESVRITRFRAVNRKILTQGLAWILIEAKYYYLTIY